MSKQIVTLLIIIGCSSSVSFASDREVLKTNPYNVDQTTNPNVVIGVERTREDTLESAEVPTTGVKVPLETVVVEGDSKPNHISEANPVSTEHIVANVTQPTINEAQRKLIGSQQEFLMVTKPNSRVYVSKSDGKVYFHAKAASLKENVTALLSVTNTHFPLVYEVSDQHSNPTEVWLYGDTTLDILNALLSSYTNPHPIESNAYSNRVIEIFYDRKNRRR